MKPYNYLGSYHIMEMFHIGRMELHFAHGTATNRSPYREQQFVKKHESSWVLGYPLVNQHRYGKSMKITTFHMLNYQRVCHSEPERVHRGHRFGAKVYAALLPEEKKWGPWGGRLLEPHAAASGVVFQTMSTLW